VPVAYMLSQHTPLGVNGIWVSIALTPIINGVATLIWFETGRWRLQGGRE